MRRRQLLTRRWRKLSITTKFMLAFGLLLALIVLMAVTGFVALNAVRRQTDAAILTSLEIQRLVLEMDGGLQQARRFEKEFFLRWPTEGYDVARQDYAEAHSGQIARVIAISGRVEDLIDKSEVSDSLRESGADLSTYGSLVKLYANSFNNAVELAAQLAESETGVLARLDESSTLLRDSLQQADNPRLIALFYQMQSFEKEYLLTRQRPKLQSSFNVAVLLQNEINASPQVDAEQQIQMQARLDAYETVARELLATDNQIRTLRKGFDLQATSVDPISAKLIAQAGAEAQQARGQIAVTSDFATALLGIAVIIAVLITIIIALLLNKSITRNIIRLTEAALEIEHGNLDVQAQVDSTDELGQLAATFNQMTNNLSQTIEAEQRARAEAETANEALEKQVWQITGQAQLSEKMRGEQDIPTLATNVVQQLCHYLKAQIGALYVVEDQHLNLAGGYAYNGKQSAHSFKFGQGLVGQTALEKQPMVVADVPDDYLTVSSGLGETAPRHIMLLPFMYGDRVMGVVELATLAEFSQAQLDFLQTALTDIAIAFNTAQARTRIDELLAETQRQAEELQAQSEGLRVANEELEAQTESLRVSENKLKEKQTELETTNTQLEEQAAALEESSSALREKQVALDRQNQELKTTQRELEVRAEELVLTSRYKSEFLANMSHELRTPLNSLLILAQMLVDNEEGNLSEDQIESAQIIYNGGQDLLELINDILDLSKVESGKMSFNFEPMPLNDLTTMAQAQFSHVAEEKGLDLNLTVADDLPASIKTDPQRVKQIIKNLFSNAFKFTTTGSVSLNIYLPDSGLDLSRSGLEPSQAVAVSVADTGIGMTPDQQKIIFEAFQQADGSTNRQYGGTGLGLSISRELASKLGGQINVESEQGKGSTFTLYLPIERESKEQREAEAQGSSGARERRRDTPLQPDSPAPQLPTPPAPQLISFPDDRDELQAGDKILLIIEDDPKFAKIVYGFAHKKELKCLIAGTGKTGLQLAKNHNPKAIVLDLHLPDISGWDVLEVLKNDPETRHIPVHIMSVEEEVLDAYRKGAMGYLTKPVSLECLNESFQKIEQFIAKEIKTLLLVEDDANARRSVIKLLGGSDVQISEADRGQAALELLQTQHFDCMILDLSLPDMSGFEVLSKMNGNGNGAGVGCPVIVYTGRDLTPEENVELMKYADSVIVKGVKSPERLLDETALFLHRVVAEMPKDKRETIKHLYNTDGLLKDKKILIVDDDMRNSFALSKLLSDKGIIVSIAQNGQKALDLLAKEAVDLILMDIMMPVMDGYETTRQIRTQPELNGLPILALTAKAMKGDREKCLEAGANDYLPKPIDVDRLFSMLRVWLYQ